MLSFQNDKDDKKGASVQYLTLTGPSRHLIRHPKEQQFRCVERIKQFISVRELKATGEKKSTTVNIFDGKYWLVIPPSETQIDCSHPLTHQEMQSFSSDDSYFELCQKLIRVFDMFIDSAGLLKMPHEQLAESIGGSLEEYFNHFSDPLVLYKRNMKFFLDHNLPVRVVVEHQKFLSGLRALVAESAINIHEIQIYCEEYFQQVSQENPRTEILRYFNEYVRPITQHCRARMIYVESSRNHEKTLIAAKEKSDQAVILYKQKNFIEATALFKATLVLCVECYTQDAEQFRSIFWNLGRSLQESKKPTEALSWFEQALKAYELYTDNSLEVNKDKIEKIKKAIQECQTALAETEVHAGLAALTA